LLIIIILAKKDANVKNGEMSGEGEEFYDLKMGSRKDERRIQ
jgi:hypothetical protein